MYKIDYKNIKKGYNFSLLLIILLFWIVFGYFVILQAPIKKMSMDSEVMAYKVEIREHRSDDGMLYQPTYYYRVDDKTYTYTVSSQATDLSNMQSKKMIYYKSSEPFNCVSEYETSITLIKVVIIFLLIFMAYWGASNVLQTKKLIKRVKWLERNGTLIKNLKYEMIPIKAKKGELMAIQVDYELASGEIIKLTGEPRYDKKTHDADGFADLLIDINNIDNYYIDFNIEHDA